MPPFVVGISGATKAGKTTLTDALCRRLCGDAKGQKNSRRDKVMRYMSSVTGIRVSVIAQDSFFKGTKAIEDNHPSWDFSDTIDHDAILKALQCEIVDEELHCVLFEGFKAFWDERVLPLLSLCLWIRAPREFSRKRKMRNKTCTEEFFKEV